MSFQSLHLCFMFVLLQLLTLPRSVECVRIHLSEVQCARACEMIQNGQTQRQVAMTLGVSQSATRNIWNRFQDTGSYSRRPGTGVWRSTNDRDDRYLHLLVRRNTFYSARRAHIEWRQACGVNVSIQTARNRLHDRGLNARRPHVVPDLTARHRRLVCSGLRSTVGGPSTNWVRYYLRMNPDSLWTKTTVVYASGDVKVNVTTPSSPCNTTAGELVRSWSGVEFRRLTRRNFMLSRATSTAGIIWITWFCQ